MEASDSGEWMLPRKDERDDGVAGEWRTKLKVPLATGVRGEPKSIAPSLLSIDDDIKESASSTGLANTGAANVVVVKPILPDSQLWNEEIEALVKENPLFANNTLRDPPGDARLPRCAASLRRRQRWLLRLGVSVAGSLGRSQEVFSLRDIKKN